MLISALFDRRGRVQSKGQKAGTTTIKFHQAGFFSYEHQDKPVDFVVTKNALHILPDCWKMTAFLRIAAMLKVKDVLYLRDVIFSFPPADYKESINSWIRQVAKPEGQRSPGGSLRELR